MALKDKYSVVITESVARKFFGTTDVLGKRLDVADNPDSLFASFVVGGVMKDPPIHSSLQFDILIPFSYLKIMFDDNNWLNAYLGTFIRVKPGTDTSKLTQQFAAISTGYIKNQAEKAAKEEGFDKKIMYGLQSMTAIHLDPMYSSETSREGGVINGNKAYYSYFLGGIAFFILLMAAINFINFSNSSALRRAKEIGVRKVTGGTRRQIIVQFLTEAGMICACALLLSMVISQILLPLFNQLAQKQISVGALFDPWTVVSILGLFMLLILLAGLYPAIVISRFNPREVLYNQPRMMGRNWLGKGLVVLQFVVAIFLIIVTMVYYSQMHYVKTKDLGYRPDNLLQLNIPPRRDVKSVYAYFSAELMKDPTIKGISLDANMESDKPVQVGDASFKTLFKLVDPGYLDMLDIKLQKGRVFSAQLATDKTESAIVNEAFVRAAKLQEPLGATITTDDWFVKNHLRIIGVTKDFHHGSLKEIIQPMVMVLNDGTQGNMVIKVDKANHQKAIASLEKVYRAAVPGSPFEFSFFDEMNARQYERELRWFKIVNVSAFLSLFICALGLFGLTRLAVRQRFKEIGIRKILGATAESIAVVLSRDLFKLVLIAFLVAAPIGWFVMNSWLSDFAYRVNMSVWTLVFTAAGVFVLSLCTVGFQALKAASGNPVDALRTE